ncbi:MAG: NUDIX domain-containing protein [Balneolaceae bacterium]|nr:NUDIX domain-containing protein [Balneolaceae bacterium]
MSLSNYKNRLRIRVNGLLVKDDALLLVKIHSPVSKSDVWMPPGGGMKFGEAVTDCLRREFREETGLEVDIESLRFVNELLKPPFHAIELYFDVRQTGGKLQLGHDPEQRQEEQLLKELKFIPLRDFDAYPVKPESLLKAFSGRNNPRFSSRC